MRRDLKDNKMEIGILGYGEIGQALKKIYNNFKKFNVKIKDLERDDGLEGIKVLNICIPFSNSFVEVVTKEINRVRPKLTIIHSTIAPETVKKIEKLIPKKLFVVHSPIRGVHPNLYEGVKIFVKYVGGDLKEGLKIAEDHLKSLGLNVKKYENSITTEVGKLLSTSYYGLIIAWHGEMKKICEKYNLCFEDVVTDFNKTYNEGYTKLNKKNVIRPVLYPPKGGEISGHCIISNAKILKSIFNSEALDLILRYSQKQK